MRRNDCKNDSEYRSAVKTAIHICEARKLISRLTETPACTAGTLASLLGGKKDDRQVILKWQPPTFVHGKEAEEMLKNLENEQSDNEEE